MSDKPIPESYWVLPGKFLAGGYPISSVDETIAHQCLAAFIEAGTDTFFDLTREGELPAYQPFLQEEAVHYGIPVSYQRVTIQDKGLPSHDRMADLLDALDAALADGRKVYLHCWGGIGRTGTTVGCWLVRHGLSGGQALVRLNELYQTSEQSRIFPRSPETDAQVNFILGWVEDGLA
jgi:Cyclin-dependent kinase inhibitor 3 (CDKN3)